MFSLSKLHPTATPRTWYQRLLGTILPSATLLLALVLEAVPFVIGPGSLNVPGFFAPVLFFWSIHRPRSILILLVFAFGLCADIIHATPLGVHGLAYLIFCLGAKSQSQALANLGLLFNWAIFSLAMISFAVIKLSLSLIGMVGVFDHSLWPAIFKSIQLVLTTIVAYLGVHLVLSAAIRLLFGHSTTH